VAGSGGVQEEARGGGGKRWRWRRRGGGAPLALELCEQLNAQQTALVLLYGRLQAAHRPQEGESWR
jgi:hypothetical protein